MSKKDKKNKKKKRGAWKGMLAIAIVIAALGGAAYGFHLYESKVLDEDIQEICAAEDMSSVDLRGIWLYQDVEKSVKDYLTRYNEKVAEMQAVLNEEEFENLLKKENYQEDGPKFNKSFEYLDSLIIKIDDLVKTMEQMASDEAIEAAGIDYGLTGPYLNLFLENMNSYAKKLMYSAEELKEAQDHYLERINQRAMVLGYLSATKDNWKVENNRFTYDNNEMLEQYNGLIQQVQ